jgi:CHAD domain-containing protein
MTPNVRAALRADLERALELLSEPRTDDSIHAARQSLKRARAALRLLRETVAPAAFERENAALRDAARPLGPVRDAKVMLDCADDLLGHKSLERHRAVLLRLRARLQRTYARRLAEASSTGTVRRLQRIVSGSLKRTARWRPPRNAAAAYFAGLLRVYEHGQRELEIALARGNASALHEWRKQVKYFGTGLALLSIHAKPRKAAEEIAQRLGDDHDLAAMTSALRRLRAPAGLVARLEKRRRKLQKRSVKLARRLYKHPPERFAARYAA